jgi:hypothetical protein
MNRFIVVIYSAQCGTACKNGKNVCVADMNVQCIRRVEKAFYDFDIKCEAWVLLGFAELYLISKKNMQLLMKRKGNIKEYNRTKRRGEEEK